MTDRKIAGVALYYGNGFSLCAPKPKRHGDLLRYAHDLGLPDPGIDAQGFIADDGVFVDRKTALTIAGRAGQIIEKVGNEKILFSEDLW